MFLWRNSQNYLVVVANYPAQLSYRIKLVIYNDVCYREKMRLCFKNIEKC